VCRIFHWFCFLISELLLSLFPNPLESPLHELGDMCTWFTDPKRWCQAHSRCSVNSYLRDETPSPSKVLAVAGEVMLTEGGVIVFPAWRYHAARTLQVLNLLVSAPWWKVQTFEFMSKLCQLLKTWPWVNHLNSVCLSCPDCQVGMIACMVIVKNQ
jgi:hypothetical protein